MKEKITEKYDIIERLVNEDLITDEEASVLAEAQDFDMMFSMYGEPEPREKNINRVIAGLKATEFLPTVQQVVSPPGQQGATGVVDPMTMRKIQILELQMKKVLDDQKELHNRYVSLLRSQNQLITRNNELTKYVNELVEWSRGFRS